MCLLQALFCYPKVTCPEPAEAQQYCQDTRGHESKPWRFISKGDCHRFSTQPGSAPGVLALKTGTRERAGRSGCICPSHQVGISLAETAHENIRGLIVIFCSLMQVFSLAPLIFPCMITQMGVAYKSSK